ncbi:hypothetical protein LBA_00465 [Megavirus lba]|uniref:Uncharacterized protein n=1 Tax=Megavirus lba TaxID=1235314 RepID=L7Y5Z4_9VIRU|nr:hypothetical protein LBA_00465 [Megavirus lba]
MGKKIVKKCLGKKQNGDPCAFKTSSKCGNLYCNKHVNIWRLHGKEKTHKLCKARTQCYTNPEKKGFKKLLDINYEFSHCQKCRSHENKVSKARRNNINEFNNELTDVKKCKKCSNDIPLDKIITTSKGQISLYCERCFNTRKKTEKNRGKRDRKKYSKKYENTPARKESVKKRRKENPEKTYKSYTTYRSKKLNEDPDGYRKKNAEIQAKYRALHPEKFNSTERYNTSADDKYNKYELYSEKKGYDFELTKEEFKKIVESDCYYCGCPREKYLNGIDRLDNDKGYIIENTVPACKICNNMKNSLNESTFILMCAHITTYNMLDEFGLFSDVFNDYNGSPYNTYITRAKRKNFKFDISLEDFNKLRNENPCYICGRYSNENHKNGIDRIDNNQGYFLNNCKSCCGDCNYLKREISYSKLIMKCMYIAANHKNKLSDLQEIWTPSKFRQINTNKLSKEELDELKSQRKKKRHEKTLSSKTPEAIQAKMDIIKRNRAKSADFDLGD